MPTPAITDEDLRAAVALRSQHPTTKAAADAAGMARKTFEDRLGMAARRGMMLDFAPAMPGFEVKQVSSKIGGKFVTQTRAPGAKFEIPEGQRLKSVSAYVDEEHRWRGGWIKTNEDAAATFKAIETAVDELKKTLPRVKPTRGPVAANALLLNQYTVTDLHFGMLAWAEETGDADYDLKIAEKLLLDWFSAAIALSPKAAVGVLAQLGDLMHHDALESVTPAHKHVLDADSRLQKIIRVVIRVIRQIIAMMLQKYPTVHVIMASANHDPASSAWMRELLHAMYEDEPRITIDNSPDIYYVYEWGKTALFYHHGHKRKIANVDSVFAGKFREIFGRCPKAYGHIGHLHNDEIKESNLMKVERHRTLAPSDSFASGGGWLSDRDAKVITYHREFGEVFRSTISPQMLETEMAKAA